MQWEQDESDDATEALGLLFFGAGLIFLVGVAVLVFSV